MLFLWSLARYGSLHESRCFLRPPPAAASGGRTRRYRRRRLAQAAAPARDLRGVTLRVGTYKGLWRPLLQASGQADTPYKIDWRELNNGVLHIEAINGDALDLGSGSEIPPVFAARQKSSVRWWP